MREDGEVNIQDTRTKRLLSQMASKTSRLQRMFPSLDVNIAGGNFAVLATPVGENKLATMTTNKILFATNLPRLPLPLLKRHQPFQVLHLSASEVLLRTNVTMSAKFLLVRGRAGRRKC